MPSRTPLTPDRLNDALAQLPGWAVKDGKLHRNLKFPDFVHAFRFMTAVALYAEKMDHHPDWSNVYNTVTIDLHTHDAGGITEFDLELARRINEVADR